MAKRVIVTDLDGTLLHPRTYVFDAARPALSAIREEGIPLILCSSKTRKEIEVYRQRLGNVDPFVSENGGGIFIPRDHFPFSIDGAESDGYRVIALGRPYEEVRCAFSRIRESLGIRVKGFGDMTPEDIAHLTALPLAEAGLSRIRDFDEPFVFEEGERRVEAFLRAIEESGLRWTQGRLFHVLGDHDKGRSVKILKGLFERLYGPVEIMGLGDSFNDLPMLREVDRPVLLPGASGTHDHRVVLPNLLLVTEIGPEGWNRAVLEWIAR